MKRDLIAALEKDKEITISAYDLSGMIDFVRGGVYRHNNGALYLSIYTGDFWVADCYELDEELNVVNEWFDPIRASDLSDCLGFLH